jgi:hypothetical protein
MTGRLRHRRWHAVVFIKIRKGRAMTFEQQVVAATRRSHETSDDRAELDRRRARQGVGVTDTAEQVQARVDRLSRVGVVDADSLLRASPPASGGDRLALLERIIDQTSELQPANFLARGARTAATGGRIVAEGPRTAVTLGHRVPDRIAEYLSDARVAHAIGTALR